MANYNILCINPGSTSTKIAVFENGEKKDEVNLEHSAQEISAYSDIVSQLPMRRKAIEDYLVQHGKSLSDFDAIAARALRTAGTTTPVPIG